MTWAAALAALWACACERTATPRTAFSVAASLPATLPATLPVTFALVVPKSSGAIRVDAELEEPAWHGAVVTGAFVDNVTGTPARPYSEARLLHDDKNIAFVLYAADEDIRVPKHKRQGQALGAFDHFLLRVQTQRDLFELAIAPDGSESEQRLIGGVTRDPQWRSGVHFAIDRDGTVNDPSDEDEEWVVEATLPFAALGASLAEPLRLSISRCDTLKNGRTICSNWGGAPEVPPLGNVSFAPD